MTGSSNSQRGGFTIPEVAISMAVFSVLIASVFSIAVETSTFIGETDTDYNVQAETNRAYLRLAEILRKSGWNDKSGTTYPRVASGGAELQFRMLTDLDGNGYAYDETNGGLEWSSTVLSVRRDPELNTLGIYDGDTLVHYLGSKIQSVNFASYVQKSTLHYKEIEVTINAADTTRSGHLVEHSNTSSVFMRN